MWINSTALLLSASLVLSTASSADEAAEQAAVAKQLPSVKISLQQGLTAAASQGQLLSAKFEVDEGHFQLSVYTAQGKKFYEVILDHRTGKVAKVEPITQGEDLAEAKSQAAATAQEKIPLKTARGAADAGQSDSTEPGTRFYGRAEVWWVLTGSNRRHSPCQRSDQSNINDLGLSYRR